MTAALTVFSLLSNTVVQNSFDTQHMDELTEGVWHSLH